MLIRIKCSLHEYCVPVLFIASVTYLNIWEHFLWNEVHIDQCRLDSGRDTFVGILIVLGSIVVLAA